MKSDLVGRTVCYQAVYAPHWGTESLKIGPSVIPDESTSGSKYFWIILTGLVSLAVGVGGGLILHRLTVERADLEYELKISDVFGPGWGRTTLSV